MKFYGQLNQDRWVIRRALPNKREGVFLDLAAANGVSGSNTYVLEKEYGWTGLCIEPNPHLYKELVSARSCKCAEVCVDGVEHDVELILANRCSVVKADYTDYMVPTKHEKSKRLAEAGRTVKLRTRLLADLLEEYNMPPVIDYFSFDVEGAETNIMRPFPFDRYTFLSMTVERPSDELRARLHDYDYRAVCIFNKANGDLSDVAYVHKSNKFFKP